MKSLQTKWRWCSCLLLLLFSLPAYTQININGRVIDEKDDSPLPGPVDILIKPPLVLIPINRAIFIFTTLIF
jgi:hypothetical protein